jgi:phosphodiesterase/alkaline phosphatase D-like protein
MWCVDYCSNSICITITIVVSRITLTLFIILGFHTQYEYGVYTYSGSPAPERTAQLLPIWEQIDLQDYRLRQATYHLDEGLRNLRYALFVSYT